MTQCGVNSECQGDLARQVVELHPLCFSVYVCDRIGRKEGEAVYITASVHTVLNDLRALAVKAYAAQDSETRLDDISDKRLWFKPVVPVGYWCAGSPIAV